MPDGTSEGEMREKPRKARIRLELTERQREQIREATGREDSSCACSLSRARLTARRVRKMQWIH